MSQHTRLGLALAHRDTVPMAIGCSGCGRLPVCGGLRVTANVWNCDSYCRCGDRASCQFVCPNKLDEFARRYREVDGFEFDAIGRAPATPVPDLPGFVPLVYGGSRLTRPIPAPAVAVPLWQTFYAKTGSPRFRDRRALLRKYRIAPDARLVLSGVSRDRPIERFWDTARPAGFLDWLAAVRPAVVTVPNFSLFNEVPREDNLHAMKRIAICWQELASRGIPTALHLNARTERDWQRWEAFVSARPEITAVAFEFGTGAATRERGEWHASRLARLASRIPHPLTLVVRGGWTHLGGLTAAFDRVVFVSATPFVKTMKRRRLMWADGRGRPRWARHRTPSGGDLDALLAHNLSACEKLGPLHVRS